MFYSCTGHTTWSTVSPHDDEDGYYVLLYLFDDNLDLLSIILDSIPVSTPLGVVTAGCSGHHTSPMIPRTLKFPVCPRLQIFYSNNF
jgi:hypothetical protein